MADENIYTKLLRIQQGLKAPKGQYNKFGGYAYRSAEDILEAVKPLLEENGCILTLTDNIQPVVACTVDGVSEQGRYYVEATATLINCETPEEHISVTAYAREDREKKGMDGAQITGSASSYARKYALNGLFCIDDTKDPDATNDHGKDGKAKTYRNGKTKAQAMEAANAGASPVEQARGRLNRAIEAWAARTGADAKKSKNGITKRPGYEPTEEFYNAVAEEFEESLAEHIAAENVNG